MKFFFVAVVVVLSFQVNAQIVSRDSLMGTWVCTQVKELPSGELDDPTFKSSVDVMAKAYHGSTFTFGSDGKFHQTLTKTSQDFTEMLKFLDGRSWYFNSAMKRIFIGEPSENLMYIDILEENHTVYFLIVEFPLQLKMEKR
jgi:hypothetical protein